MGVYDNNGMTYNMPVAPAYFGGGMGDGLGLGGGSWFLLFILLMFCGMGGWGMGGMGGWGMMGGNMMMWPWLMTQNTDNLVQSSANQQAIASGLSAIQANQNAEEVANCGRAMDQMRTSYENQISSMQRSFDAQTAIDGRLDSISRDLDQCCCKNQLATESLRATILSENCQDRYEAQNNTRDIIQAMNQGVQTIRDDIRNSDRERDKETIATLRNQLYMKDLASSQTAQTAALIQDNNAQTAQLIQRIAPYPVPAWTVNPPYAYNQGANWGGCNYGNGYGGGYAFGY